MTRFAIASLAIAVSHSLAGAALACSCYPPPPPCEAFWAASAVFSGKVTKVTRPAGRQWAIAEIEVLESFRGKLGKKVRVGTEGNGAMCGFDFVEGSRYIVYADGAPDTLSTHLCSRTRLLSSAKEDVEYIRGRGLAKTAVVTGTVRFRDWSHMGPLADVEVRLGSEVRSIRPVRTDAAGNFRIEVPPGNYELLVTSPGMRALEKSPQTRVALPEAGACATRNATLVSDGRIAGRVVDSKGSPIVGLPVEATAGERLDFLNWDAVTDEGGRYEIVGVAPGSFLVGVSIKRGRTPRVPHAVTYFPGTGSKERAIAVTVGVSEHKSDIDFTLPEALEVFRVDGRVTWPDGSPVSDASVRGPDDEQAHTDSSGHFQMSAFRGSAEFEAFTLRGRTLHVGHVEVDIQGPQMIGIQLKPR